MKQSVEDLMARDAQTRRSAREVLRASGLNALPALEARLRRRPWCRACIHLIAELPPEPAKAALISALQGEGFAAGNGPSSTVKAEIIGGLGRLRAKEAEQILKRLYNPDNKYLANTILWALGQFEGEPYTEAGDPWVSRGLRIPVPSKGN